MEQEQEQEQEQENIKRTRGRPKKLQKQENKGLKPRGGPRGRPRIHEKGYDYTRSKTTRVEKNRYNDLLEIERKYLEINNI